MAKQVNIPEDREVTNKEYMALQEHLRNSVIWYATNMAVNSAQIIERLQKKGLTEDPVMVTHLDGRREEHFLVEECLTFLKDSLLMDDEAYARRLIERTMGQGKGTMAVKSVLRQKLVDDDLMEELLEEYEESDAGQALELQAMAKIHARALGTNAYKKEVAKLDSGQYGSPRNAVVKYMASRGFSFNKINDYLDSLDME